MFGEGKYYSVIAMSSLKNITGKSMELVSSYNYPFLMRIFYTSEFNRAIFKFYYWQNMFIKTFSNNNLL